MDHGTESFLNFLAVLALGISIGTVLTAGFVAFFFELHSRKHSNDKLRKFKL